MGHTRAAGACPPDVVVFDDAAVAGCGAGRVMRSQPLDCIRRLKLLCRRSTGGIRVLVRMAGGGRGISSMLAQLSGIYRRTYSWVSGPANKKDCPAVRHACDHGSPRIKPLPTTLKRREQPPSGGSPRFDERAESYGHTTVMKPKLAACHTFEHFTGSDNLIYTLLNFE